MLMYYDDGWTFDGGGGLTIFDSALVDTIMYFVSSGGSDTTFITNVFLDSVRNGDFGGSGSTDTVRIGTGLVATGAGNDSLAAPGDTISVDPDAYSASDHNHDGTYETVTNVGKIGDDTTTWNGVATLFDTSYIYVNVDFYSASLYYYMGIAVDLFTPLFAISRIAGWVAHVMEEQFAEAAPKPALYRPESDYIGDYCGPDECAFVPMTER